MAKPISKDPFDLARVSRSCDKEGTYFSVVANFPELPGEGAHTFKLFDANRDVIYEGTRNQVSLFLEGLKTGCLIGLGKSATARQKTLFGEPTKAPRAEKPRPLGQRGLFG